MFHGSPNIAIKVLAGYIGQRAKDLIRRSCNEADVKILPGSILQDHVHMLISINPSISISSLVKYIKRKTSRKLQMEFPELRKRY